MVLRNLLLLVVVGRRWGRRRQDSCEDWAWQTRKMTGACWTEVEKMRWLSLARQSLDSRQMDDLPKPHLRFLLQDVPGVSATLPTSDSDGCQGEDLGDRSLWGQAVFDP